MFVNLYTPPPGSLTLTLTRSFALTLTLTLTRSFALSLTRTRTRSFARTRTRSFALTRTRSSQVPSVELRASTGIPVVPGLC